MSRLVVVSNRVADPRKQAAGGLALVDPAAFREAPGQDQAHPAGDLPAQGT